MMQMATFSNEADNEGNAVIWFCLILIRIINDTYL